MGQSLLLINQFALLRRLTCYPTEWSLPHENTCLSCRDIRHPKRVILVLWIRDERRTFYRDPLLYFLMMSKRLDPPQV